MLRGFCQLGKNKCTMKPQKHFRKRTWRLFYFYIIKRIRKTELWPFLNASKSFTLLLPSSLALQSCWVTDISVCMGEVNKCIATVVAGQGNIDVTAAIITLVGCVNGNVMFDQLARSKALRNTIWTEAQTKTARESTSEQFPPKCRALLQRWAFAH